MTLVVTGAGGFLGRHVTTIASTEGGPPPVAVTRATSPSALRAALEEADAVIHLAGVNRPTDPRDFTAGNVDFTRQVLDELRRAGRRATFVLSSSTRAGDATPYGVSKREAEQLVQAYARDTGASATIFRLPNVFGKWSRPDYNSAIATFCHRVARDEPIEIHDADRLLTLVYGEDAARALLDAAATRGAMGGEATFGHVTPVYERRLGDVAQLIRQFRALRTALMVPDLGDDFVRKLYGTYVSFLPLGDAAYPLRQHRDERGALAELLKSPSFGQLFVSRTLPGITRGNHFHHTKTEKFVVLEGEAVVRLRPIDGDEVTEVRVQGSEFRVVDIPTGFTHSISNVGSGELVTLFWASEIFDPSRPDTYPMSV